MAEKDQEDPLTPKEVDEQDDAPEGEDADAKKAEKKKKIKRIILTAVPIAIVIISAILFFLFVIKTPGSSKEENMTPGGENAETQQEFNTYLDIDSITISLASSTDVKKEFLRLDLVLRLSSEAESASVLAKMPIIKDSLITFSVALFPVFMFNCKLL